VFGVIYRAELGDRKLNMSQMKIYNPTIIKLLKSTNRQGIEKLIEWLKESGFFECPASHRFHGVYCGGLAKHSYIVYDLLVKYDNHLNLKTPKESLIIAALLHDVCKINAYIKEKFTDKWTNNPDKEKGHATLSIERIKKFIELTDLEEKMIKYHMGVYGLKEFDEKAGEYTLRGESMAHTWYHNPIVKIIYFCDELATFEEKNVGI